MKGEDGKMMSITQRRCMMPVSCGGIEIGTLIIRTWTSSVSRLALFCSAILMATLILLPSAHGEEKCSPEIDNYLNTNFGYSMRDMAAVTIHDTTGTLGITPTSSPQAASYKFSGLPPSCNKMVTLRLDVSCQVYQASNPCK
jgi:hypothetical protein